MSDRRHYQGSKHNEIKGSKFFGGQKFFFGSGKNEEQLLKKHTAIFESLQQQTEKRNFLGLLSPASHEEFMNTHMLPTNPKLFWIFKNLDYKQWESAAGPQVLWLLGPPDHGMTEASSYIASHSDNAVFYFSGSTIEREKSIAAMFTHSFLYYIIDISENYQAKSVAAAFVSSLIHAKLSRDINFQSEDSPGETFKKILNAPDGELLEALTAAVFEIKKIQEISIIIDSIHMIGQRQEGVHLVKETCWHMEMLSSSFRALLTSQTNTETPKGVPCIEYDKERKECLSSLHFDTTRYENISEEHTGSLEWLWRHKQYKAWSSSETSALLYLEGKPGSGKSTLVRYFRENVIENDPSIGSRSMVHYFYTERGTHLERTHKNMLQAILWGILEQDGTAFYLFQYEFRKNRELGGWSYKSLKDVLSLFANHPTPQQFCLILDAMDESEQSDRRDIINLLCQLCSKDSPCNIKVFLASRPVADIEHRIVPGAHHVITLQEENKKDIEKLANDFLRLELRLSDDVANDATEYISNRAEGVFIWVRFVLNELLTYVENGCNVGGIIDFLKEIPWKELRDLYKRMLKSLDSYRDQDIEDAMKIFQFALFARRPLSVVELYNAVAIPENSIPSILPCDQSFERDSKRMEKRILHCGGNFLEVTKKDKSIQPMHQTVREFFLKDNLDEMNTRFIINPKAAQITITTTCLRYIQFCFLNPRIRNTFPKIDAWDSNHFESYVKYLNDWPFTDYALENFKEHLGSCDQDQSTSSFVSTLIKELRDNIHSRFFGIWMASHLKKTDSSLSDEVSDSDFREATHRDVAKIRLYRMTDALVRKTSHLSLTDWIKSPTKEMELCFKIETLDAAENIGLPRVTKTLLLIYEKQRENLLLNAAEKGHTNTVQFLLDRGVDIEFQDKYGQRALHHAVKNGHETVAKLLIRNGVNTEVSDKKERSPLLLAILKCPNRSHLTATIISVDF